MSSKVLPELILTFRRKNSHIPDFGQSQDGTKYQVLSTKTTSSPHHFITSSPHHPISTLAHSLIITSAHRHIAPLALLLLLTLTPTLKAQLLTPLSNEMNRRVEYEMIQRGTPFFTVMKPYVEMQEPRTNNQDNTQTPKSPEGDFGQSRDSVNYFQIDTSAHRHIVPSSNHLITSSPFSEPRTKSQEPRQSDTTSSLHHLITSSPHHLITSSPHFPIDTLTHRHTGTSAHYTWFHRKLFHESLIQVDSGSFYLFADPVFEFGIGRERSGRSTYINTRGLRAGGRLGKYVAFGTEFYENQGIFNSAISAQVKKTSFFPGHGIARKYDSTGYDFSYSSAYVSVTLMQKLNIRLAQGRQFIGDGYRSLLLSDAAYAYPYLKFTWQSNMFLYSWDHLLLQDYGVPMATRNAPVRRKTATIHTAAINIKNRVQLSVIKMQLYNNPDSFGNYTFRFSQFNPLLIPGNIKNSHAIWGFNLKVTPLPKLTLYSQFTIDNLFSDNEKHFAVQVGGKYFINVGSHLFYLQAEYNHVPAMTYTSQYRIYSWKNLTEPLAHPYGHNFKEAVLQGAWNYKRWQINTQATLAQQLETITDTKPYTQAALNYYPNSKKLYWYKAELTYYFNPKTLMNVSVGFNYRKEMLSTGNNTMNYIYFSFGTRLFNKYYDF